MRNPACPCKFLSEAPSVPPSSAAWEQILPTPSAFANPQLGWNELSQCLFPLPQLFLSLLHNNHSALLCRLDPSPPRFGLCMASPSGVHSPLTLRPFLKHLNHSFVWVGLKDHTTKHLLDFSDCFNLSIAKLLTKLDAIPLSNLFRHNNKIFVKI